MNRQYANVNQANIYGRWGQGTVTHASGWNGWNGWNGRSWSGTAASGFNPYTGGHFQASPGGRSKRVQRQLCGGPRGIVQQSVDGSIGSGARRRGRQRVQRQLCRRAPGGRLQRPDRPLWCSRSRCDRQRKLGRASGGVARRRRQPEHGPERRVEQRQRLRRQRRQCFNVYKHDQGGGWEQHSSNGWQPATPAPTLRISSIRSVRDKIWVTNARADNCSPDALRAAVEDSGDESRVNVSVRRLAACLRESAPGAKTGIRCD